MFPGTIAFTRTPFAASSTAKVLVKPVIPALRRCRQRRANYPVHLRGWRCSRSIRARGGGRAALLAPRRCMTQGSRVCGRGGRRRGCAHRSHMAQVRCLHRPEPERHCYESRRLDARVHGDANTRSGRSPASASARLTLLASSSPASVRGRSGSDALKNDGAIPRHAGRSTRRSAPSGPGSQERRR